MSSLVRTLSPLLALAIGLLSGCSDAKESADEVQPTTLLGEWQLTQSGGGITGKMEPVPASTISRLVFRADSTYRRYGSWGPEETNAFRVRRQPAYTGGPTEQRLLLKTSNTLSGQPEFYSYHLDELSAQALAYRTPGGCPLVLVYKRVKASAAAD